MIDLQKVCYAYEHEVASDILIFILKRVILWSFRDRMDVENQHLLNC